MKTVNILPTSDWHFTTTSTGTWTITGGSIAVETAFTPVANYPSIKITPSSTSDVTLQIDNVLIPAKYGGQTIQFHSRIKCDYATTVSVQLTYDQDIPAGYDDTRETNTVATRWIICRSNKLPIENTGSPSLGSISVAISGHQGEPVYVAIPYLLGTSDTLENKFALSVYAQLPRFITRAETTTATDYYAVPDLSLFRILEAGLVYAEQGFDSYYNIERPDVEETADRDYTTSPSYLVDAYGVDPTSGEWLAQFLGFDLDDPRIGPTPWFGLPETWVELLTDIDAAGLDATPLTLARSSNEVTATFSSNHGLIVGDLVSVNGVTPSSFDGTFEILYVDSTTQVRWAQTGDNVANGSVTVKGNVSRIDTQWSEIVDYAPDFLDIVAYVQWQILTGYNGINGGTRKALIETAKFNLSDTKTVTVVNGYSNDPWHILVKTKTSETPEGVDNTENESILNAIRRVKPAGFKVSHLCTSTGL